jgi:hypothetical protein
MSEPWKPAIQIWPFKDAPEEFRRLSPWGNESEELVIFVPPELCDLFPKDDWVTVMPRAFWFLSMEPKCRDGIQYAGDDFGSYSMHHPPGGGRVVITAESVWDKPPL